MGHATLSALAAWIQRTTRAVAIVMVMMSVGGWFVLRSEAANASSVILITLDTTRADRMGFLGSKRGLTPNLDRLARQAVVFERAYSQAPITTVSHATILTGTYPQFHHVNDFGSHLPTWVPYLPQLLQEHGYRTAAFVGSIILDPRNGLAPGFDRGFDFYDADYTLQQNGRDRFDTVERRGDRVIAHAIDWLGHNSTQPFFLWIHLFDPHQPYDPPPPYAARFASDPYDGEIAYTDAALGKLFSYLRAHSLYSGSLIAVMADHGEALGEHGEETHGIFLYDETIHVPLVVKFPNNRFAGRRVGSRVRLVDVAPTIAEVVCIPVPKEMQGESLVSTLKPGATDRDAYSETDYPQQGFGWSPISSLRDGRYLFIEAPRPELYDTIADPPEMRDIAGKNRKVVELLKTRLMHVQKKYSSTTADRTFGMTPQQKAALSSLSSLGYVAHRTGGGSAAMLADPKDKIQVANELQDATLLVDSNRSTEAIPLLRKVAASDPSIYFGQLELGLAEVNRKNYGGAVAPLERATELMPGSARAQYELGFALFEIGDKNSSAMHFERAVTLMPKSAEAHYSLGSVYARIDRVPDAVRQLRTALAIEPVMYRANLLLGRILSLEGDGKDAVPYLQQAVKSNPSSREAHLFLGDVYKQLGRQADARAERETASRLPPIAH
ncbi:MAG TPA: sulfatase-like hydrolase/transferase [Candidatus Acidoferrales bacterium]